MSTSESQNRPMTGTPALSAAERTRQVAVLGRLGSEHDGGRSAWLLASRLVAGRGLGWDDVILAGSGSHAGHPDAQPRGAAAWQADLAQCRCHIGRLSTWEQNFLLPPPVRRKALTPSQAVKLAQIAEALRARGLA